MFKFILAEEDLDDTIIDQRITEVINKDKNYLYKPRSVSS